MNPTESKLIRKPKPELSALARFCPGVLALMCVASPVEICAGVNTNTIPLNKNSCIVFFGDSITAKGGEGQGFVRIVNLAIKQRFVSAKVVNAGRGWDRIDDLRDRYRKDVLQHRPTVVVIEIGINNIVDEGSESNVKRQLWQLALDDLVWRIKRDKAIPVLTTLTLSGEQLTGREARDANMEAYNTIIKDVAAANGCYLVDFRTPLRDYVKANNPNNLNMGILTSDGAHMNDRGNRILAEQLLSAFGLPAADVVLKDSE